MAKRKKKKPLSRVLFLKREEERKNTKKVTYGIRYRVPQGKKGAGTFVKFRAGRALRPEIWLTKTLRKPDDQGRKVIQTSLARTQPLLVRKAKKPLSARFIADFVERRIVKRKRAKKKIETVDNLAQILYPDKFKAKETGGKPIRPKRKKAKKKKAKRPKRKNNAPRDDENCADDAA